jgi:TFIIF-interacting CTD phosphatase-like protein
MTRQNTIIVDNDPVNYLYDQGNAVPIDTYLGSSQDDGLLKLQNQLVAKNYYALHIE